MESDLVRVINEIGEPLRRGGMQRGALREVARIELGMLAFGEAGSFNALTATTKSLLLGGGTNLADFKKELRRNDAYRALLSAAR